LLRKENLGKHYNKIGLNTYFVFYFNSRSLGYEQR
jgi:hypothetical protein